MAEWRKKRPWVDMTKEKSEIDEISQEDIPEKGSELQLTRKKHAIVGFSDRKTSGKLGIYLGYGWSRNYLNIEEVVWLSIFHPPQNNIQLELWGRTLRLAKSDFILFPRRCYPPRSPQSLQKDTLMGTPSIQDHGAYAVFSISGRNDPLSSKINAVCCPL